MPESLKAPASIPPTAKELEQKREDKLTPKDALTRAGILMIGSAMVVFTTRRAIYDRLRPFLKAKVTIPLSDSQGFALQAGLIGGLTTAVVKKKKQMSRREMLALAGWSLGAGAVAAAGAALGSQAVDEVEKSALPEVESVPNE